MSVGTATTENTAKLTANKKMKEFQPFLSIFYSFALNRSALSNGTLFGGCFPVTTTEQHREMIKIESAVNLLVANDFLSFSAAAAPLQFISACLSNSPATKIQKNFNLQQIDLPSCFCVRKKRGGGQMAESIVERKSVKYKERKI